MEVATIEMPREKAAELLKKYRNSRRTRVDAEYQRIAKAYEAMAEGTPIIQLSEAFKMAPLDAKGRPRLAIARSDRRQVYMQQWGRPFIGFNAVFDQAWNAHNIIRGNINIPFTYTKNISGYALVPLMPPDVNGQASQFKPQDVFILWEVEEWSDRRIGAKPDIDPMLLRRLDNDLYAVLATWDLTPVERAILAERAMS